MPSRIVVAVLAAGGIAFAAGSALAKKPKPPKDHLTFTYKGGTESFSVTKKGKVKSPVVAFAVSMPNGNWRKNAGGGFNGSMAVTLDSYDKKKHKLTGHFTANLADALPSAPNGALVIPDGQFQVTVPKALVK